MSDSIKPYNLLNDQALHESGGREIDGLGFDAYASVLTGVAKGTEGPFTIGVFGEWGTGKTSLMQMMQKKLDQEDRVITVWFNAWRYENLDHPVVPLVAAIIRKLQENRTIWQELGKVGEDLIKTLRAIAYSFSIKARMSDPANPRGAFAEASLSGKEMIERFDNLKFDPLLESTLYDKAFDTLSKIRLPKGMKLVVFIDDLDRCFPDQAVKLLEAIKLILSQPGTIFFLGVARTVIEGYLQHRYEDEFGIKNFNGHKYLDKIVQLPFYVPDHASRIDSLFTDTVGDLREQHPELERVLPIVKLVAQGNPRTLVRFLNNLIVDQAVSERMPDFERIPLAIFAVTRGLQQLRSGIIRQLVFNDKLCKHLAEIKDRSTLPMQDDSIVKDFYESYGNDDTLIQILFTSQGNRWLRNDYERHKSFTFYESIRTDSKEVKYGVQEIFLMLRNGQMRLEFVLVAQNGAFRIDKVSFPTDSKLEATKRGAAYLAARGDVYSVRDVRLRAERDGELQDEDSLRKLFIKTFESELGV